MGGWGQHAVAAGIWNPYGWAYVTNAWPTDYRPIPKRNMADRPCDIGLMADIAYFGVSSWAGAERNPVVELLATPTIAYLTAVPVSHPTPQSQYVSVGKNVLFVDNHVEWRTPATATVRFPIYYGDITY